MSANQSLFQSAMNRGHSAAWDRRWDQATQHYRQALEQVPDNPIALSSLGLALYELQELDEALRCYTRVAEITPQDPAAFEKIGRIYERLGRPTPAFQATMQAAELFLATRDVEKALEAWVRSAGLHAESPTPRLRMAGVFEKMGKKVESAREYLAVASLVQRAGDPARALQFAQHALALLPESLDVQQAINLIKSNQLLPKPVTPKVGTGPIRPEAVPQLTAPAGKAPAHSPLAEARQQALAELAELLFEQTDDAAPQDSAARRDLSAITRGSGGGTGGSTATRIQMHLSQAIEMQSRSQDAQAAEELERALELGVNRPAVLYNLGLLQAQRNGDQALRVLQQAVYHPDYALASYLLIGQILETQGNFPQAVANYLQAMRLADAVTVPDEEKEALAQQYEPIIESQQQMDPGALKTICQNIALQLLRSDWREYLQRARQQIPPQPAGSPPVPLAEMLLEASGGQIVEAMGRVRRLAAQGLYRSAMEEAFNSLKLSPTYLPLHVQMGEILLREGHIQEAVEKFLLVSQLYSLRGESGQAVRLLQRVVDMAPLDIAVRTRLIELLTAQGRVDEAVQQYIALGEMYYQLADLDSARTTYHTALKTSAQAREGRALAVQILQRIADLDLQRLDWRQALRSYEQIRSLRPEDAAARTQIIDLNLRLGSEAPALAELDAYIKLLADAGKLDQADVFVNGLLADHAGHPGMRRRRAGLLARHGQLEQAADELGNLADEHLGRGDRAAAIEVVKEIIQLNPPNVAEYQTVLRQLMSA